MTDAHWPASSVHMCSSTGAGGVSAVASDAGHNRVGDSNRGAETRHAPRCHTATWVCAAAGHPCDRTGTRGHTSVSLLARSFLQMASKGPRYPLFFHTIWHLMLFGSERRLLLTVKNLLIAPGGPMCSCLTRWSSWSLMTVSTLRSHGIVTFVGCSKWS